MARLTDCDGNPVTDGCIIGFSYGIPPVRVRAKVIKRGGRFIALTPGHNPDECPVRELEACVGDFWVIDENQV